MSTPKKFNVLMSPGFLFGLFLLLVNDYYLKQVFPGAVTGKLSDFAGLFVFGIFVALLNQRRSSILLTFVGLLFVFWKSSFSDYFIVLWNLNGQLLIGRTVDYSDLIALTILPVAYKYMQIYKPLKVKSMFIYPVFAVTVFSIMGTSPARYGVGMDVTEKKYMHQKNTGGERTGVAMKVLHDAAMSYGLKCLSCDPGNNYRRYEGKGAVLELNYAPDKKRVYIGVYAQSYRVKYEEQKVAVEKLKARLDEVLKKHSYDTQASEKAR